MPLKVFFLGYFRFYESSFSSNLNLIVAIYFIFKPLIILALQNIFLDILIHLYFYYLFYFLRINILYLTLFYFTL